MQTQSNRLKIDMQERPWQREVAMGNFCYLVLICREKRTLWNNCLKLLTKLSTTRVAL